MRTAILISLIFTFLLIQGFAQVGINTDGSQPDPSAILDAKSSNKGILIPRMTAAQRAAIPSPVNGLMVYQDDEEGNGFYYYNMNTWQKIGYTDGSETKIIGGNDVIITGTGTIANPYTINHSVAEPVHYTGEFFGGGIVFWVDNTGQNGLIGSLVDVGTSVQWSPAFTATGALSTWNGLSNSTIIAGISPAAQLCNNYINSEGYGTGVYSDWYLPSQDELRLLYDIRYILNKNIEGMPGANVIGNSMDYWSSTEDINDYRIAFCCFYLFSYKNDFKSVRAVRAFGIVPQK